MYRLPGTILLLGIAAMGVSCREATPLQRGSAPLRGTPPTTYSLRCIEPVGEFTARTRAFGLNNRGEVIAEAWRSDGMWPNRVGLVWSGGAVSLLECGNYAATPTRINNKGLVVGYLSDTDSFFCWENGVLTPIEDLGKSVRKPRPTALNEQNEVLGYATEKWREKGEFFRNKRVFYWTTESNRELGIFLNGFHESEPTDLNDAGQIVGCSTKRHHDFVTSFNTTIHAWLLEDGIATRLPLPTTTEPCRTKAMAINNRGKIVGWYASDTTQTARAVLWDQGKATVLRDPSGGLTEYSIANDINLNGNIVGVVSVGFDTNEASQEGSNEPPKHASVWRNTQRAQDLNRLLDSSGAGWILEEAIAVNDLGQIVGNGTDPSGRPRAFLLTPSSPVSHGDHP